VAAAGGGYFRADNSDGSSPSTTGIYLILPESRGYVPRGLDTAATVDPDGASRYLGDIQLDAYQGHYHTVNASVGGNELVYKVNNVSTGAGLNVPEGALAGAGDIDARENVTDGTNGTPRIDSESRMTNFSTKFVVWY
jgi:hypothetical protein